MKKVHNGKMKIVSRQDSVAISTGEVGCMKLI